MPAPALRRSALALTALCTCFAPLATARGQSMSAEDLAPLLERVEAGVNDRAKLVQVMIDKIFSFSELGQQEIETSAYVTGILEENGFDCGAWIGAGIPTAWFARWGSGSARHLVRIRYRRYSEGKPETRE